METTERKVAEKKLIESERKYRMLFENSLDAIHINTMDGRIVEFNQAMLDLFGYSKEELLQTNVLELYANSTDRSKLLRDLEDNGAIRDYELKLRKKDGTVMDCLVSGSLIVGEDGEILGIQGITHDITERKILEENFRRSLDDSPLGIRIVNGDGRTVYTNQAMLDLYGYDSIDELNATPVKKRYTPESYAEHKLRREKREHGEYVPSNYEISIVRKDSEIRHLEVFRKEILWNGRRQFQVLYNDITTRRQAEKALRESEQKYRILCEYLPQKVFYKNRDSVCISCNKNYARDLKIAPDEIVGKTDYDFYPKDLADKYREGDRKVIESGKMESIEENFIEDGQERTIETFKTPVRDESGNVIGVLGISHDITERKRAEVELKRSYEKLRAAMDGTIKSIAMITEIRDPYTAGHQRRVAKLASSIAEELGLSKEQSEGLRVAGLLHDIGKVYVPAEILSKPGRLSETEMSLVKVHPETGNEILKTIEFPWPICRIVYQHHERINGSGYPSGISGDDICLEAKILAVADVVEAMSSHRPYRPGLGITEALEEISQKKGVLYDANAVDACLRLFTEKGFKF